MDRTACPTGRAELFIIAQAAEDQGERMTSMR